jgi:hypothetical protein
MSEKEPREHGILFGRGDELGDNVEEPPMAYQPFAIKIPVYGPGPVAFGAPPTEPVELTGDIPWELQDEGASEPAEKSADH